MVILAIIFWVVFFTAGSWLVLSVKSPLVRLYVWEMVALSTMKSHIEYLKKELNG
jgi:hypothetical protein